MGIIDFFFPVIPEPEKPKPRRYTDRQIAEILIATLQAQLHNPLILAALRPGLTEGLNAMNELITEYEGCVIDPAELFKKAPERKTPKY
jgi:hypothetical protein